MFMMALALLAQEAATTPPPPAPAPAPPARAEPPEAVSLICQGTGGASRTNTSSGFGFNNRGGSGFGALFSDTTVPFEDQVVVEITGNVGRIRMPRAMLPIIRGGKNGWFEIKNLQWAENEVTGSVAVYAFNNPKLRLDRIQGAISLNGKSGDFAGRCERYDPASVERKF